MTSGNRLLSPIQFELPQIRLTVKVMLG